MAEIPRFTKGVVCPGLLHEDHQIRGGTQHVGHGEDHVSAASKPKLGHTWAAKGA